MFEKEKVGIAYHMKGPHLVQELLQEHLQLHFEANRRGGDIANRGQPKCPADVNRKTDLTRIGCVSTKLPSSEQHPGSGRVKLLPPSTNSSPGEGAVASGSPGANAGDCAAAPGRAAARTAATMRRWIMSVVVLSLLAIVV
ncbi:glucose-6-phosphate isomerase [Striga asiatica]|uniref:Glucose-6-phosphate isomerase n=1 Tax=Striga asiatica TaxID=4170 RepID=A0A5A7RCJ4_STRAF|nr:glucose-6-phosphate isomerase [Striga asiatica]